MMIVTNEKNIHVKDYVMDQDNYIVRISSRYDSHDNKDKDKNIVIRI